MASIFSLSTRRTTRPLGDRRARFDRFQFSMRLAVVYALAAAAPFVESAGPERSRVAVYLALVVGPAHLLVRLISGLPNPAGWLDLLAVAAGVGAAAIEPELWAAALLFQMLTLGGAVAFLQPKWMAGLSAGVITSMAALAYQDDVELAPQLLVVSAIFIPVLVGGTMRKTAREQRASMRLRAAVESLPLIIWEGDCTTAELRSVTGRTDAVLARRFRDIRTAGIVEHIHPDDRAAYLRGLAGAATAGTQLQYRYVKPDGTIGWLQDQIVPGGGRAPNIVRGVTMDVTEREEMMSLVRHQATHDGLTGLANREVLLSTATEKICEGRRVVLALIDLNEFKSVNDTLGHLTGDEYLREIAVRLAAATASADLVVRLGGDEFATLLLDPPAERVTAVLDQITATCREPIVLHGAAIAGSASVGVAAAPLHANDAESLLRCADLAMYASKRDKTGPRVYDPSMDRSTEKLELLGELGRAFAATEFEMWFQPKMSMLTSNVSGYEALVRWRHPQHGVLAPPDFLELISIAGYGDELANTALRGAARALAHLPDHLTVAVNLTARDVRTADLPERCATLFAEAGVECSRLIVEVTESEVLEVDSVVGTVLGELAAMGATIAVDDFGTGFSSLSHLRSLPLGQIKIDRQFVRDILDNDEDRAIVTSMVEIAHHLSMTVTAEGVEDEATAATLLLLGCDEAQGWFFGRPAPDVWTANGDPASHGAGPIGPGTGRAGPGAAGTGGNGHPLAATPGSAAGVSAAVGESAAGESAGADSAALGADLQLPERDVAVDGRLPW